jgi:hypothetical protein
LGQLLDDVYGSIQESVLPVLAAAAKGSTIMSDGWRDVHRHPILNFMNMTRGRAMFLKPIGCTDHMVEVWRKYAAYISSQNIFTIEEFSPKMLFKLLWMES